MTDTDIKKILFISNNKINDVLEEKKNLKEKKRVVSKDWTFDTEKYKYENQLKLIKILNENNYKYYDDISKIMLQEITKKIYGYKQQDKLKNKFEIDSFINIESIITKMIECELKCYYCKNEMLVLYDISREMNQWSVDRINNDNGHNLNNYHLACLSCNLKRRRRTDEKFLFTKQLKLVKKD